MAQQGKTWSQAVDVSGGDYDLPTHVRVQEMRVNAAGTVRLQDYDGGEHDFVGTDFDIYKLGGEGLRRVRQVGTTAALRTGAITLFGYYVSD
jgi:hypothetical protein